MEESVLKNRQSKERKVSYITKINHIKTCLHWQKRLNQDIWRTSSQLWQHAEKQSVKLWSTSPPSKDSKWQQLLRYVGANRTQTAQAHPLKED